MFVTILVLAQLPAVELASASTSIPYSSTPITVIDGTLSLTGHLFRPAAPSASGSAPAPGVLVVHEWWGLNAYADQRAHELTETGSIALAVDLYGATASEDFPTAVQRSGTFYQDPTLFVRRIELFLAALRTTPGVDPTRISAIGFCFGGSAVLQAARAGLDMRAVVAFHPSLTTSQPATTTPKAKILVCHGGSDPFVSPSDVATFIQEMATTKASWRMEIYGSAVHAFTNPRAGLDATNVPPSVPFAKAVHYDAEAEAASLAAMRAFLADANH